MVNIKEETREQNRIAVGPLMKKVIEQQKKNISEITKGVCDVSNWEASEVLAKKIVEAKLV